MQLLILQNRVSDIKMVIYLDFNDLERKINFKERPNDHNVYI